jgi:hypothetical protein
MLAHARRCLIGMLCLSAVFAAAPQSNGQRIVAIGDIHGDFDAFVEILQRARIIDPVRRWAGGRTVVVQTGDFLDRGPKSREVMDFLMSLQRDAQRQGGRVVVLMGNHEAMNVYGDLRYVTNEDYAAFAHDRADSRKPKTDESRPAGFFERCEALGPGGMYGKWLRSLPVVARIQDSIFLHGGISPELIAYSLDQLNETVTAELKMFDAHRKFLVDKKYAQPCSTLDELAAGAKSALEKAKGKDAETLKAFLGIGAWLSINDEGPLWYRGYAQWTDSEGPPLIEKLLKTFNADRFVVGHTTQAGMITTRFNEKVYLIDTGMLSSYYRGGRASALNIQDGKISFVY